eukprot:3809311-Rhodomonas_salina.2
MAIGSNFSSGKDKLLRLRMVGQMLPQRRLSDPCPLPLPADSRRPRAPAAPYQNRSQTRMKHI